MVQKDLKRRNWILPVVLVLALLAVGGAGYYYWQAQQKAAAAARKVTYQTNTIIRGNISLTASGRGTVVAGTTMDLKFPTGGTLATLNVQPGDQVKTGQVLAVLGGQDPLKLAVQTQQLALNTDQTNLTNLQSNPALNLAQAQQNLATAQANLDAAQKVLRLPGVARCSQTTTENYYYTYLLAQKNLSVWESYLADGNTSYGLQFMQKNITRLRTPRDQAYANWQYCQGFTQEEISTSQTNLKVAQSAVDQAQAAYDKIKAANGLDPDAIALAQARILVDQNQLSQAQKALAGATMLAAMDGTVMAVNGAVGDTLDTSTFITIADLGHPLIQTNFDQTDLINVGVGCSANVTFDSIPNQVYPGSLTTINPSLVTVNNAKSVQGLVALKTSGSNPGAAISKALLLGANASVDVICSQANNVLLAPVEALHMDSNNQYFVYVLNAAGQAEKRAVSVGLISPVFAEIRGGLQVGEKVIIAGL